MEVYVNISLLNGQVVTFETRTVRWEKSLAKSEKERAKVTQKRQAAEIKLALFKQSIDKAIFCHHGVCFCRPLQEFGL